MKSCEYERGKKRYTSDATHALLSSMVKAVLNMSLMFALLKQRVSTSLVILFTE